MDVRQMRSDPDIDRLFGPVALAELAGLVDSHGDCDVCHRPLGEAPISLAVHRTDAEADPLLVLPAHAACRASGLTVHPVGYQPYGPANTYIATAFAMPVTVRPSPGAPPTEAQLPVVLLNPSVDQQYGRVVDGHWLSDWENAPDIEGLVAITTAAPVPSGEATWGAAVTADGGLVVSSPSTQDYRAPAGADLQRLVQDTGRVLVLVSDQAHARNMSQDGTVRDTAVDMAELGAARAAGRLYGAWAQLGREAMSRPIPRRDVYQIPEGGYAPSTMAELTAMMAKTAVEVRAAFSDHPAVGLGRIAVGQPDGEVTDARVPVLLLEPREAVVMPQPDSMVTREGHVETAIAAGLDRFLPAGTSLLNLARDWRVSAAGGVVQLITPNGTVLADGRLRYPPGWRDAADTLGCVLVIYGTQVGVRPPAGRSYNDADRHAELQESRRAGVAAWGVVTWQRAG